LPKGPDADNDLWLYDVELASSRGDRLLSSAADEHVRPHGLFPISTPTLDDIGQHSFSFETDLRQA